MRRADPTPADLKPRVLARDGYRCVAPRIDPDAGPCRDAAGRPLSGSFGLELDHVRPEIGSMTVSVERWCVTLCPWHHRVSIGGRVWATSHREAIRGYLAGMYGEREHDAGDAQADGEGLGGGAHAGTGEGA